MTASSVTRIASAALPFIALAALAPAAKAQDSILLTGPIAGDYMPFTTGTLSQFDSGINTTLVSGVAKEVQLSNLEFESMDPTPLTSWKMRVAAYLLIDNTTPFDIDFFYTANFSSDAASTSVGYSSASQTYTMPGGGSLQVSVPGSSLVTGSTYRATVPMTATFLYTAPSASASAAPEPGSIALALTAGVPVAGLVRRRKK